MKKINSLLIIVIFSFSVSCGQEADFHVQNYEYEPLAIPDFFLALIDNHLEGFYHLENSYYHLICQGNDLDPAESQNLKNYFTISILHDLFTTQTAANYSRGEIFYIPYLWHWVNPNPRHRVYFVENDRLLSNTNPPPEFGNYQTYADIDRTPYLFLSDLVLEKPKYYTERGGSFSSFGWCSEREMAFIALTTLMNFEGKIVASGNHSWSELLIPMIKNDRSQEKFRVIVDNTFNTLQWRPFDQNDLTAWNNDIGSSNLASW
ncbi:MAG: hypothetical protein K0B81_03310 [Candidatus Cloacimonetes bacterium]|nr:hypothetical protein [Candidatus Cloacimonadota bacterium]